MRSLYQQVHKDAAAATNITVKETMANQWLDGDGISE